MLLFCLNRKMKKKIYGMKVTSLQNNLCNDKVKQVLHHSKAYLALFLSEKTNELNKQTEIIKINMINNL